ncbi:kinase-like domain-containing protein [Syncephalis plumigaleata]|nr:kinase-like domain-containing protein [Syncephalis plumigaleata]
MDVRHKNSADRSTLSLDLPSTPPSTVIRPRCHTDRHKLAATNSLPPIPASPTSAVINTQPYFKDRNLSVATLACPPSSLHPSILQRLELAMADDPVVQTAKPPNSTISAASIASSLSDHSAVDEDEDEDVDPDNDTWSLPSTPLPPATSAAPIFLKKLEANGARRVRRRTSETDVASCRRDNYHMPGPSQLGTIEPYVSASHDGHLYANSNGISNNRGNNDDDMIAMPTSRSDKVIRFWSRLRNGGRSLSRRHQRTPSNVSATATATTTTPIGSTSPVLSSTKLLTGRKLFSGDIESAPPSYINDQYSNKHWPACKPTRSNSKSPVPMSQPMHYSLSASAATISSPSSMAVKETSKVIKEYDPRTGNKMLNQYMVVGDLGRGVHGKVKLARDTITGQSCAIKVVDKAVRRRYRMSQYGRMSRNGFGGNHSPNFIVAGSPELAAYSIKNSSYGSGGGGGGGSSISAAANMPSSEQPHLDKIRREIAILKKCRHPNVVRLIEVIDDPQARKIYLVLELLDGGEVRWKQPDSDLPLLSQSDTRRIFRDVVLGLEYLHHQGIVHRDIKPANLLMTADTRVVKITDFGVSHLRAPRSPTTDNGVTMARRLSHRTCSSGDSKATLEGDDDDDADGRWADDEAELAKTVGSPAFFAPELCYAGDDDWASATALSSPQMDKSNTPNSTSNGRPPVTKSIDIWALGVTLYCLVYGRCPFMAETEWELFSVIPRKELVFPDDVTVPATLIDLMSRLLTKDPSSRITLSEVKRHPWVVEDLDDPERWRLETDPARYTQVAVSEDEVTKAVTFKERIRDHIRRLSVTLGLRRKSRGTAQALGLPASPPLPHPFNQQHHHHHPLMVDTSSASSNSAGGGGVHGLF